MSVTCHLLRLPREIRLQIWELLLLPQDLHVNFISLSWSWTARNEQPQDLHTAILYTCRTLHVEAAYVLYSGNEFRMITGSADYEGHSRARLSQSLDQIGPANVASLNHIYMYKYQEMTGSKKPSGKQYFAFETRFRLQNLAIVKASLNNMHQEDLGVGYDPPLGALLIKLQTRRAEDGALQTADVLELYDTFMRPTILDSFKRSTSPGR